MPAVGRPISQAGPDVLRAMTKMETRLRGDRTATVRKAAMRAKGIHNEFIRRKAGSDMSLSGVRKRKGKKGGAKVGSSFKVKSDGGYEASGLMKATGPMPLIERDTPGRVIVSSWATGNQLRAGKVKGQKRSQLIGPRQPGDVRGDRRAVLNIPGIGFRKSARHPGTKGSEPWKKGYRVAKPTIRMIMRDEVFRQVQDTAKP